MKYTQWTIPQAVVTQTEAALLSGRHEVFAIWTAPYDREQHSGVSANITRSIIPAQTPGETADGVYVHIAGSELQRIQLDNYRRNERSVVQLHTHPGADVRMSSLDRKWEVVRHVGALSIIVPFYGMRGLSLVEGANIYERELDDWRLWSRQEAAERMVLL
ncbi:hypothetical protein ACQUKI_20695 [Ralstonia pseudosolanacearum]